MVESKNAKAGDAGDTVLMTVQLQEFLNREEFSKALKYCSQRKYQAMPALVTMPFLCLQAS